MLHVHNVAWLGGVTGFLTDFVCAFPEFDHWSVYLNDSGEDTKAIQMLNDGGLRTMFCPKPLTEAVIRDINPLVIILHNIIGSMLDGTAPWDWIRQWPTINYHHNPARPLIPTDLHVFVSKYLFGSYKGLVHTNYIHNWAIIPPCIRTENFSNIDPAEDNVIGKIANPYNKNKYPSILLEVAQELGCKLAMPGAKKYYGDSDDIIDVPVTWWGMPSFLSRLKVFVYLNKPGSTDTWCRAITEAMAAGLPVVADKLGAIPEQIDHGIDGFLVEPGDKDTVVKIVQGLFDDQDYATQIGTMARIKAREIGDISVLRRELAPHLLSMIVGGYCD